MRRKRKERAEGRIGERKAEEQKYIEERKMKERGQMWKE
jgi:hypothetical protein